MPLLRQQRTTDQMICAQGCLALARQSGQSALVSKSHRDDVQPLFVVVRVDLPLLGEDAHSLNMSINLVEAVPTKAEADAEAQRLNEVNDGKGFVYFAQYVRHFPDGRGVNAE